MSQISTVTLCLFPTVPSVTDKYAFVIYATCLIEAKSINDHL